ncbi:hypothetical protein IWW38_000398 [Coemansia aciculifera]|uniref:Uncharacterized protein n=1 Tax=Coemansia aciculifera TaxID=417176 RepID=A0ACC1MBE1_9FUNG|nr:hypothetical protein IWW38_000398 [Coemansia aciculifera]
MHSRVAVVTGANGGVGLAIARRLLSQGAPGKDMKVVLACRNQSKAMAARAELLAEHPQATVDLVELDTSSVASVERAAAAIQSLCPAGIDLLFCNAGAMAIASLDVVSIVRGLLLHPVAFFESSEALRQKRGLVTADGLGEVFQTNVFGHYLLITRLQAIMSAGARIVWTGSAASRLDFKRSDYQHVWGGKAYESSKYIVDQIVEPLDKRLQPLGIRCVVAEPGNVCTNFLAGLGLPLFEYLVVAVFYFIRVVLGLARFTITADAGAVGPCYAALADNVDSRIKYHSHSTRAGQAYVEELPLESCKDTGSFLIARLDGLVKRFDSKKQQQS